MRTKVFAYKGYIGIMSDMDTEGLINDPAQPGQMGFVLNANFVDISPEALELLKQIPKSGDDIGDVDVFKADDDTIVFAFFGGPLRVLNPNNTNISGSSEYDPSLLTPTEGVEVDESFKDYIDSL